MTARDFIPETSDLNKLRSASQSCRGCHLYKDATQAVFGEGKKGASIMLVGEQPGDQEDRQGHPFVGPAGKILDEALSAAGISRVDVYVTNVVKHFKWAPKGKRRIHRKSDLEEIKACKPWLEEEINLVQPKLLILLGATASQAFFGPSFKVTRQRGIPLSSELAPTVVATIHPSSVLRAQDRREQEMKGLVEDLIRALRATNPEAQ